MFRFIARILFLFTALYFVPDRAAICEDMQVLKAAPGYRNIEAKVTRRISLPEWYHEGLFYDGKSVWVVNGKNGNIWVVDILSGNVLSEITPIGGFTEGVARISGDMFAVTDWDDRKIYRARIKDGALVAESETSLAPAHPAGVVCADDRIFVITWTRGMGTKFDLLEMDKDLAIINRVRIARIEEPAHMAWDGKNLWITSWYSRRVYKVDIDKMQVLGSFVSPVGLATGITWDGKRMWLTGTYGDLYELEML